MKLAPPAYQAVTLNLIDAPDPGRPIFVLSILATSLVRLATFYLLLAAGDSPPRLQELDADFSSCLHAGDLWFPA